MSQADVFGPGAPPERGRLSRDAWARFIARFIDIYLLVTPVLVCLGAIIGVVGTLAGFDVVGTVNGLGKVGGFILGIVATFLLSALLESICLAVFGATPGKAIMGVRVRDEGGQRIGFVTAIKRWGLVLAIGRGLSIPLVTLWAMWSSLQHYEEHAETTWDDMLHLKTTRNEIAWWRWTIGVGIYGAGLLFGVISRVAEIVGRQ